MSSSVPKLSTLSNPFSPNYSVVFNFEERFDVSESRQWMSDNWNLAFIWVAVYMIVIFGGQSYMSSREPFQLRKVLCVWNLLLSAFSIIGTFRTLPEMIHVLNKFGFSHSVCNPSFIEEVKVSGYWTYMFVLSKVPELGINLFILYF